MTKYILNSGNIKGNPQKAKKFFAELVNNLGSRPKILICFFALPREIWEEKFALDLKILPEFFENDTSPSFKLAMPDTFVTSLRNSDAIYLHGGDDHLIQYWLKQFKIPDIWEGKVIATSSASSHALSKEFWTCDWRKCMNGLGILPIKFLAHFKSEYGSNDPRGPINWKNAYDELKNYGDRTLPIYALAEGDYKIIEVN